MAQGVITLGEMWAKRMTMLEVACRRCERQGRLRIERLIAEHGPGCWTRGPSLRLTVRACGTLQMIAAACIFPNCRAGSDALNIRRARVKTFNLPPASNTWSAPRPGVACSPGLRQRRPRRRGFWHR